MTGVELLAARSRGEGTGMGGTGGGTGGNGGAERGVDAAAAAEGGGGRGGGATEPTSGATHDDGSDTADGMDAAREIVRICGDRFIPALAADTRGDGGKGGRAPSFGVFGVDC